MTWLRALTALRAARRPGVLVTLASVRGHAPREPGAKMVVADDATWGSVGGGNLEAVAVERSRAMLRSGAVGPETLQVTLSERVPLEHGVQCCGGEVVLVLDPVPVVPAVAIFGVGHVGLELARILARHDLELHLVDSRVDQLAAGRLSVLDDAVATVHVHSVPVLPELVLADLPAGTHVLVMTHDHAEDAALCDAALRADHLGPIGLIGSRAKWARFRQRLLDDDLPPELVDRVVTPIGLAEVSGKSPATVAVSVAAALLRDLAPTGSTVDPPADEGEYQLL